MRTNQIIGYRVKSGEQFVHTDFHSTWISYSEPTLVSQPDAYRRAAAFIEEHPAEVAAHGAPVIEPFYRETTPAEDVAGELSDLLQSLCSRHGMQLGMTKEQIQAKITEELKAFGAYTPDVVASLRR